VITLATQLMRSGLGSVEEIDAWFNRGQILVDGRPGRGDQALDPGMIVNIRGGTFRVAAVQGRPRLLLLCCDDAQAGVIAGRRRVHAGLHKCLTMYTRNILQRVALEATGEPGQFRHFYHRADEFYRECHRYQFASISGHAIDLDRFEDIRVSRFIRDPRDLLVSGYFYHKRGAEHWTNFKGPVAQEWAVIGAPVPESLPPGVSLSQHLNQVSVEQGLLVEIEFRRRHFDSMRRWPRDDPRVRCYRYEDIVGNERQVFGDLFEFYQLPWRQRRKGVKWAAQLRAEKRAKTYDHIRDPRGGQWRKLFTPAVSRRFEQEYGGLLEQLGYA
jgi:hypothetical protein